MGRPKKQVYAAGKDYLSFTEELIRGYPSIKEYCLRYEQSHKGLLEKLDLQEVYASEKYGYEEPFIQYSAAEGRDKDALEEYLDAKKKIFFLEHHIENMEDAQMKEVATALFLKQEPQKNAVVSVEGHILSKRTVCREKQRAISYIAWCVEGYSMWEAKKLFG